MVEEADVVVADVDVDEAPQLALLVEDPALDPGVRRVEVVEDVAVPGYPDTVVVGPDGSLVVVSEEGPALAVVDPATGAVDQRWLSDLAALGDRANLDATVLGREVWVTSHSVDRVHHLPVW